jgi:hypothetical protein
VVETGNADRSDYERSVVRHGREKAEAGRTLVTAVPGSSAETGPAAADVVTLIVGADYSGGQAPGIPAATASVPEIESRTADEDVCA